MSCCRSPHCWPRDRISNSSLFTAKLHLKQLFDPSTLATCNGNSVACCQERRHPALQNPSVCLSPLCTALSQPFLARSTRNLLESEMNLIVDRNCFSNMVSHNIIIADRNCVSFCSLQIRKTTRSQSFGFPPSGKPSCLWCPWIETELEKQAES